MLLKMDKEVFGDIFRDIDRSKFRRASTEEKINAVLTLIMERSMLFTVEEIELALTDYGKESMELQNMDSEFRFWNDVRNELTNLMIEIRKRVTV